MVARITTIDANNEDIKNHGETTFGVSEEVQAFINTGLLAALVTTILGSLMFRVVASSAPLLFLSNPIINMFLRMCLIVEYTGIMQFAWVTSAFVSRIMQLQPDEKHFRSAPYVAIDSDVIYGSGEVINIVRTLDSVVDAV